MSDRQSFLEALPDDEARRRARAAEPGGGGGPNSGYTRGRKEGFHLLGTDLFGEEIKQEVSGALKERFDFAPFSVLNAREGQWQERKRAWLSLGIKSEVGRGENLLKMSDTCLEPDPEKRAAMQAARAQSFGQKFVLGAQPTHGGNGKRWEGQKESATETASLKVGLALSTTTDPYRRAGEEVEGAGATGTSIFDPVLTELCYRWFCPPGGQIVDPFAGGSVRGLVAGLLGFRYHGIDLRPEQVEANEAQRAAIAPEADIRWSVGDSNLLLPEMPEADFVFSCPPYGDLEQYSDDPQDLSTMSWEAFAGTYRSIIRKAVARLKPNRFACFVVGEYRDKDTGLYRGFVPLTCASFMAVGAALYNEAVLITSVGSLPIRITKQFEASRKLGKTHQNVLIFCKGDPKLAAEACRRPAPEGLPRPAPEDARPAATLALSAPSPEPVEPPAPSPEPAPAAGALAFALSASAPAEATIVAQSGGATMADFLRASRPESSWRAGVPPENLPHDVVLNFETNGLDWAKGDRPIGLTVGTLDGQLRRFLPFGFTGGNLDEEQVKAWARRELRGKHITNANTRFDLHIAREWGIDLEEQGCTASDVMHWAALLDDHRRRFALDVLAQDFLGGVAVDRLDERAMASYHAADAAARAEYQVQLVADLRAKMWPMLEEQDLQRVRQLEDETIMPVVEMEKNGAKIDLALLEQYSAEIRTEHARLMMEVSAEAGFGFEHTAVGWGRLFEKCGLRPSESYAEDVVGLVEHPLVKKAHFAGQLASLDSKTFAAYRKQVDAAGILRFDINQLRGDEGGTVSGRFSIGYVQQVPNWDNHKAVFGERWFPRRVFVPATGQYLEADAAQIEYRLFAHYACNPKVLAAYAADPWMSFHRTTWDMMKAFKADMAYSHQKNLNFAKLYGAKLVKLATMMGFITFAEGEEIRKAKTWSDPRLSQAREIDDIYKRVMPEVDALLERAAHLAKPECDDFCRRGDELHRQWPHRGFVKTLLGRRSRFPTNYKTYIGLNRVLQGTAADIMKRKLVELHKARKHTGLLMRLTVHDAVCGDAQQPETLERLREILNAQSFPELKVPILWQCGTGPTWADCK